MLGLVDANNFYVSCERSFNPALEGRPVVVLSNNDGAIVARSNEAKALGIPMTQPFFQIRELLEAHNVAVFSSNYTLYGEMSARIMGILGRFVEEVEVYSIDEAFLNLSGYQTLYPDLTLFAQNVRQTIRQWTRIPVSIGLAPTKTLCKVANWYAKRQPECEGVFLLDMDEKVRSALDHIAIGELWGVGSKYAALLRRNDIRTAWDLRNAPDDWIAQHMTVNGLRLAYELRGVSCKMLELDAQPKKAICTAPSFGCGVSDLATVSQALTTHLSRAAEKLRRQGSAAGTVTVFIHTNRHKKGINGLAAKQYYNSQTVRLPHPSASTVELVRYAQASLKAIFRFGYEYGKVGVILTELVPTDHRQQGLFHSGPDERLARLSGVIDRLNHRHGRDRVRLAGQGYERGWQTRREWLSRCYTTRWADILEAR